LVYEHVSYGTSEEIFEYLTRVEVNTANSDTETLLSGYWSRPPVVVPVVSEIGVYNPANKLQRQRLCCLPGSVGAGLTQGTYVYTPRIETRVPNTEMFCEHAYIDAKHYHATDTPPEPWDYYTRDPYDVLGGINRLEAHIYCACSANAMYDRFLWKMRMRGRFCIAPNGTENWTYSPWTSYVYFPPGKDDLTLLNLDWYLPVVGTYKVKINIYMDSYGTSSGHSTAFGGARVENPSLWAYTGDVAVLYTGEVSFMSLGG
jgi:hypothetical protein